MAKPIEFYFDFSSPYGYLAAQRIDEIGAENGREVVWRPFLLGVVFKSTGGQPLLDIPMKGDYARRDLARSARLMEIPFAIPKAFPFMSVSACRATYWLNEHDPAAGKALAQALYRAAFAEGRNIADPQGVADVAADLGHGREDVIAAMQNPRIKDLLKHEVDAAQRKGVFGSPYFIVDGEPFWGYDRLEDLGVWLESGGW
ncbi:MAG: 2-hydroxychromene-2-carboxylate isomerase [Alphaproteobacteria bacterium]